MIMRTSIGHGTILDKTSKFRPKRVSVSVNHSFEECLKLGDRRQQHKLQWLQDTSEVNEDNFNNVRREASIHFRNKEREYLKDRIN
jgi:hypothetical protein